MRFKDFLVSAAIIRNYNDKIKSICVNPVLDNVYATISNKLGYKLIDEEIVGSVSCPNNEWGKLVNRYAYEQTNNPKRFLAYDSNTKSSYYFGENGMIYVGIAAKEFKLVKILDNKELYNKYGDFLSFVTYYYEKNKQAKRQYLLIGYNDKHRYYIGNDSKYYYKISEKSSFKECTPKLNIICKNLISELNN